jgi:large subunit ribosomal protein L29
MKMNDVKQMDNAQATSKVAELKKELFELKFSKHTGALDKPHYLKVLRKDIARLLTHINAK